ncbi:hypothetical protein GCM10018780_88030 [Streptomyces lanatus]|nr:hypothetical protein GCM10018780_88030 [Streptomyces lanatus]
MPSRPTRHGLTLAILATAFIDVLDLYITNDPSKPGPDSAQQPKTVVARILRFLNGCPLQPPRTRRTDRTMNDTEKQEAATVTAPAFASDALAEGTVDAVVIGGGAAGLNGALILARSRRSVVVIDSGAPRNAPAEAVHGLLALDGTPPSEILRRGREQVRQYGGRVVSGKVVSAESAPPVGGRGPAVHRHPGRRPQRHRPPDPGGHRPEGCAARGARPRRALGTRCGALPVLPRLGGAR